ncbi:MAG: heme exporter protein CcmD [Candidatus Thorarchaeota archaeon]
MSVEFRDIITVSISYTLFWLVIIILILYPLLQMRKTLKRIRNLEKNAE